MWDETRKNHRRPLTHHFLGGIRDKRHAGIGLILRSAPPHTHVSHLAARRPVSVRFGPSQDVNAVELDHDGIPAQLGPGDLRTCGGRKGKSDGRGGAHSTTTLTPAQLVPGATCAYRRREMAHLTLAGAHAWGAWVGCIGPCLFFPEMRGDPIPQ